MNDSIIVPSPKCIAIAAAVFNDPLRAENFTKFTNPPFGQQFASLWNGTLDVSTDYTTFNMGRDVYEVSTMRSFSFL